MQKLRDQALAEQKAQQEEAAKLAERQRRAWDAGRPERRKREADDLLAKVKIAAGKGLSKLVTGLEHSELGATFRKLGFTVQIKTEQVEIRNCVNYETGVYQGTGRYEDKHTLTLEW
jgi:hypothetical protein